MAGQLPLRLHQEKRTFDAKKVLSITDRVGLRFRSGVSSPSATNKRHKSISESQLTKTQAYVINQSLRSDDTERRDP